MYLFGSSLPPVVCRRPHILFAFFCVQHIVVFLFFFVLLPVSLDCLFLIGPLVFSSVYLCYGYRFCLFLQLFYWVMKLFRQRGIFSFFLSSFYYNICYHFIFQFWNCFDSVVFLCPRHYVAGTYSVTHVRHSVIPK